jgi:thiol-disulfide isomerase/thioredoxin
MGKKTADNKTPGKSGPAKWRVYAINALIIVLVVVGIRVWQHRGMVSGAAPNLQGATLEGKPYKLPERPEKPVLVHFWASWCPVCRAEQGNIAAIARDNPNVITIAMQSGKPEAVTQYMKEQGIDFPVLNDPLGRYAKIWGVHAVPASFIIAPDGQIHFIEVGYTTEIGLRLRLWLAGM